MAQPVLFNPSCTRIGTAAASRSQETRSLPRVNRTCRKGRKVTVDRKKRKHLLTQVPKENKSLYLHSLENSNIQHNNKHKIVIMWQYYTESSTYQVGNTVQITAHREEDDGPFGVGEALWIQQKGQDRQRGGQEAQHGPHRHPRVREDFGPSPVEPAVVATLESAALGLLQPGILVGCGPQRLTFLLVVRVADGLVGQLFHRTLHTHVVVVVLRWEEAAVEHLKSRCDGKWSFGYLLRLWFIFSFLLFYIRSVYLFILS